MRARRPKDSLARMTRRGSHDIARKLHETPGAWALRTAKMETVMDAMLAIRSVLIAARR